MDNLKRNKTASTPAVYFDAASGQLVIEGESYPENAFEFFKPLLEWASEFLKEGSMPAKLEIRLSYMNTSSIKSMMDLLDLLEDAHSRSREITVSWYYDEENERALEMAEDFRDEVNLPFFIVPTRTE